jgi:hypothetical protein
VEDSRKQKRRGTPNAVVLAGMSMPKPFQTPVQMPKSHVRLLQLLRSDARARAGLPPLKAEVKDEGVLHCLPLRQRAQGYHVLLHVSLSLISTYIHSCLLCTRLH